jgi:predicted AAA+ superfamily ATPase
MGPSDDYIARLVDGVLARIMETLPAVSVVGPRAVGKTTSAQRIAASTVRLDREAEASPFRIDPDAALARLRTPALLDEWQRIPEVLAAVKRSVDADPTPGRFMLTGSVRIGTQHTWPATGRVVRQPVFGLTRREIEGSIAPGITERFADVMTLADMPTCDLTVYDYLKMASVGGFPDVVRLRHDADTRLRWFAAYLAELATNDVKLAGVDPDPAKFAPFVEAVALSSSRIVDQATLRDAVGISKQTAAVYEDLLESVFFSERVPAWRSGHLARLTAMPKRYVLDSGLLMHILGVDADAAIADPHVLGAVLDTFVAAQIRPELSTQARPPKLLHLRDKGGRHEIDLLIEFPRHRIIAIEIKATASPSLADARHILWLRDHLGPDFLGGILLHTGPASFALSPGVVATPISTLWKA